MTHLNHESISHTHQQSRRGDSGESHHFGIAILTAEERKQAEERQRQQIQERLLARAQERVRSANQHKPQFYQRPGFNTPQYWQDAARGWISDQEQCEDHAQYHLRRKRAIDTKQNRAPTPQRHERPAPRESKQFSKAMSTQAARDDRLTPQSKALLQVLVARTGRGRFTDTTKTTLAATMNRCPRSIQRYVKELIQFGYIRTQVRKSKRSGFYVGLRIWIMNSVLPFFAEKNDNYCTEKWGNPPGSRRISDETIESYTNSKQIVLSALRSDKPPWCADYVYSPSH